MASLEVGLDDLGEVPVSCEHKKKCGREVVVDVGKKAEGSRDTYGTASPHLSLKSQRRLRT